MNTEIARHMIEVVRAEKGRRSRLLDEEDANFAYDQWLFTDEPFVNEMCLMILVGLRHEVERELVRLAALTGSDEAITSKQYHERVADWRRLLKARKQSKEEMSGRERLINSLNLAAFGQWNTSMKTLQLLANCIKHAPTLEPDEELLEHLHLPLKPVGPMVVAYLPLPESHCFREGLAASVGLPKTADYCTIAEEFTRLTKEFIEAVWKATKRARLTGKVSISEFAC